MGWEGERDGSEIIASMSEYSFGLAVQPGWVFILFLFSFGSGGAYIEQGNSVGDCSTVVMMSGHGNMRVRMW